MQATTDLSLMPHIFYSCYTQQNREGESFVLVHVLSHVISGRSETTVGDKTFTFQEGDLYFFRKNQLARYIKMPPPDGEFKSVSIAIDENTLRSLAQEHNLQPSQPWSGDTILKLKNNLLLSNYIETLSPYLNSTGEINPGLTSIKVKEAVMILLQINPALKDLLFDFSPPGKIDLEGYMNAHYKFNVDLNRFAFLTGRSLASFKRDFEKIFHMSPNRWLQHKRLQDAYYLLKEKGWRSSDVYLEVGFKDLSHFSFAFKKAFGMTPSHLSSKA
ncbi:AraC-type DNA-binding protein [Chitinophaga costaii]|uniref:AraC-type DNA-binding protein n=1 Tax=Chitinophaga costaii TaxID=1335309 RepID=A0A1C4BBD4_9BACT|nr:AraC family transcriptional regulator [Chitinophaga costaii]PUZ27677.1 AraC family transcriptional regulator [Chitinophaga costaii]SCC04176.1 AraC-type DNA-binding protein [Chitinophaga costaii]